MTIMLAEVDTGLDYKDARCVEAHLIGLESLGMKGALDYAYECQPRPLPKPRCYVEFCCDEATEEVVVVDRSCPDVLRQVGAKSPGPIPWGWCRWHAPKR